MQLVNAAGGGKSGQLWAVAGRATPRHACPRHSVPGSRASPVSPLAPPSPPVRPPRETQRSPLGRFRIKCKIRVKIFGNTVQLLYYRRQRLLKRHADSGWGESPAGRPLARSRSRSPVLTPRVAARRLLTSRHEWGPGAAGVAGPLPGHRRPHGLAARRPRARRRLDARARLTGCRPQPGQADRPVVRGGGGGAGAAVVGDDVRLVRLLARRERHAAGAVVRARRRPHRGRRARHTRHRRRRLAPARGVPGLRGGGRDAGRALPVAGDVRALRHVVLGGGAGARRRGRLAAPRHDGGAPRPGARRPQPHAGRLPQGPRGLQCGGPAATQRQTAAARALQAVSLTASAAVTALISAVRCTLTAGTVSTCWTIADAHSGNEPEISYLLETAPAVEGLDWNGCVMSLK